MDFFYFGIYTGIFAFLHRFIRMTFSLHKFILLIISRTYSKIGIDVNKIKSINTNIIKKWIFYKILRNSKYVIFTWNYNYSLFDDL